MEELAQLLVAYGLPQLVDKCRAEKFTLLGLKVLDEEAELDLVTSFAGEKVLLRRLIRDSSKDQRELAVTGSSHTDFGSSASSSSTSSLSSRSPSELSCATPGTSSGLILCERLARKNSFDSRVKTFKVHKTRVDSLHYYLTVTESLHLDPTDTVLTAKKVEIFGTLYTLNMVMITINS
ncbi:hypothetical protein ONE63_011322 [Megalurothrips usitatus]|uniref:Uncharacterized protein n=1 Tax=Megalurothrips usitatus TaxID=439358 RepID=A0AAV7X264_9NEOP|nr:hypothetical protein ONE63_011322 [Megalurothrips usitatus]